MKKLIAMTAFVASAATATAHFPYLVPDGPAKGKAVFSDSLKPDNVGVPVDRIAAMKLVLLDGAKAADLAWTHDKTGNFYAFDVPGDGSRIVIGSIDYGVLQRGDSKPFFLRYYAKAIFGDMPLAEKAAAGERVPLELIPVVDGGKLRFKAVAGGKPMVKAEVTVLVPGEDKSKVVATDEHGLTPAFEKQGAYGVQTRRVQEKAGEHAGKKYEEVRDYATLAVVFGK
jgi:uncharacterized GH25 family protein